MNKELKELIYSISALGIVLIQVSAVTLSIAQGSFQ